MNDERELIEKIESFNPTTDTGRAIKFLMEFKLQELRARKENEVLQAKLAQDQRETIEFTAEEMRKLHRDFQAAIDRQDAAERKKINWGRLVKGWLKKAHDDIEMLSK